MLYRITQELVSNSLKHANANHLILRIQQQSDRILLAYSDDGQGFDYEKARRTEAGLGLGGIDSRVAILDGRVNWQTQPGAGTLVEIEVPIRTVAKRRSTADPGRTPYLPTQQGN
jgi:signal transduction histidine kinase